VTEDWTNYVETSYSDHTTAPATLCNAASGSQCTSAQMAAYDLYQFKNNLATAFSDSGQNNVRAIICRDSNASSTINFNDSKLGGCTGGSKLMIRVAWKAAMEKPLIPPWATIAPIRRQPVPRPGYMAMSCSLNHE
jgi:type IV pilus assembly protein PilV